MNKSKIVWLLAIVLCLGACSKHEKDYEDVTPPTEPNGEYAITGHVTDYQGNVLYNATVQTSEGQSVKTDKDGVYFMAMPEPDPSKTYSLTATYEGKKDVSKSVTLTKQVGGMIARQDFRLPSSSTVTTFLGDNEGDNTTEFIDHNDFAKTLVGAYVEGYEDEVFQLELFYYNEDFGAVQETPDPTSGTFEKDKLFFAANVTFAEGGKKDRADILYTLFLNFDTETQNHSIIRSFNNGRWSDVPESQLTHEPNRVAINNAVLGVVYAAFCFTNITLTPRTTPLVFNPSNVDNIYGSAPVVVPYTEFGYKVGVDLYMPTHCQLQALLLEVIAREFGLISHDRTYRWDVNLTLPVGTGVDFSGHQEYTHIAYKRNGKIAEADLYGDLVYDATTYNHQHVGGGN